MASIGLEGNEYSYTTRGTHICTCLLDSSKFHNEYFSKTLIFHNIQSTVSKKNAMTCLFYEIYK